MAGTIQIYVYGKATNVNVANVNFGETDGTRN
jgi:hypothetical protein